MALGSVPPNVLYNQNPDFLHAMSGHERRGKRVHCSERATPENRELKKEIQFFFCQRHALLTSFDIFIVTYRVTKILPKLMDMLLFSREKTEFPFFEFPIFWVLPSESYNMEGKMKGNQP